MNKYIAINIGPIVDTLSMVSRPRHLWSASYLFSHLMGIIINEATKGENSSSKYKLKLVSPAKIEEESESVIKDAVVGLYPDRVFFLCDDGCDSETCMGSIISNSYTKLYNDLKRVIKDQDSLKRYINIMGISIESETESMAVLELNKKLDTLELTMRSQPHSISEILNLITPTTGWSGFSPLFKIAHGYNSKFRIDPIDKIASIETSKVKECSHHRYFCVVQADGDNMGKVIANLQDGELQELSKTLITFGKAASNLVEEAGGIPIYAGGDDLLFIAPIITASGENIFHLINKIDEKYKNVQDTANRLQKESHKVVTSMSYGVAMSYKKYPLYEVLDKARNLLFCVAKDFEGKNCVAIDLRKHSGSNLQLVMSKSEIVTATERNDLMDSNFISLCKAEDQSETMVSAVAHKLRAYNSVFMSLGGDPQRIDAFFDKFMSMDDKGDADNGYISKVKIMLSEIYTNITQRSVAKAKKEICENIESNNYSQAQIAEMVEDKFNQMDKSKLESAIKEQITETIYATLRIAKFIKGEDVKDEQ